MKDKLNELKNFYKDKKILITGHTGFKGVWLYEMLLNLGSKNITGISLDPNKENKISFLCSNNKFIKSYWCDIRDYSKIKSIIYDEKPNIIFHLAAQSLVLDSYSNPFKTYTTNINGTLNILEILKNTNFVNVFLNITTDKVYKNKEWIWGYRENEELFGFDPYSNSKSCVELISQTYFNSFLKHKNITFANIRAGNVIGGGDFSKNRIIPDSFFSIKNNKKMILRNPYSTRPYQHVLEVIYFYVKLVQLIYKNKNLPTIYNIGPTDENIRNVDLVKLFFKKMDVKEVDNKLFFKNDNIFKTKESNLLKLDVSLIKEIFNWKPSFEINDAINLTAEWYKNFLHNKINLEKVNQYHINFFLKKINW